MAEKSILFLVSQTPNQSNGGVKSVSQIICGLVGFNKFVFTQRDTAANKAWESSFACVSVQSDYLSASKFKKIVLFFTLNVSAFRFCLWNRIEIVHANDIKAILFMGLGARLAGSIVVFNIRDVKTDRQRYGFPWYLACKAARMIVVLSKEMRATLIDRLSIADEKIVHVYSAVDTKSYLPYPTDEVLTWRARFSLDSSFRYVGYVAAFMKKKRQLDFIERALPRLVKRNPLVRVIFLGDFEAGDHYAMQCKEAVDRLGLQRYAIFAGFRPEVAAWYNVLDVTVVASEREGLARCMIESLACGTPVVSFAVTSATEILLESGGGTVVDRFDYAALVDAITSLITDEVNLKKMSRAGAQFAKERFDPEATVAAYSEIYNQLLGIQ